MERASDNAMKIAEFLEQHPKVSVVNYPGLKSHSQHALAKKQMKAFGAMLSFEVKDDPVGFQKALKIVRPVMSLGGVETSVCSPALTSHRLLSAKQRNTYGISEQLLSLSVGIESVNDIIDDIRSALS